MVLLFNIGTFISRYINIYTVLITLLVLLFLLLFIRLSLEKRLVKEIEPIDIKSKSFIGDVEYQENFTDIMHKNNVDMVVLADGKGKNKWGSLSSKISVGSFNKLFYAQDEISNVNYFFKTAFNLANREILKHLDSDNGGASIAAIIIKNGYLYYSDVGNIKISVFRNNNLISLNEGHTINVLAEKKFYEGKITKRRALKALKDKRLFNYVGQDGFKDIEIYDKPIKLKQGDVVIVMNEGIYEFVPYSKMENIIEKSTSSYEICEGIISYLKEDIYKNRENASVISIRYLGK